jgi:transmembrane sensor
VENYQKISELLIRHLRQDLTTEEKAELESWLQESPKNQQFLEEINNMPELLADVQAYREMKNPDLDTLWARLQEMGWDKRQVEEPPVRRMAWWRYAAAAVVILFVSTTVYFLTKPNKPLPKSPVVFKAIQSDAKPSTSQAYLELDNGERISLDSLQVGLLATQGNTKVERKENGVLSYSAGGDATGKVLYNKVTVPKGSDVVYLQLADQSKVWLNAGSSIRYPVEFSEEERKVEITGEAYFEVTKSPGKKFTVSKGNMNVVVLGTKFNVNTYENEENIRVTLLEGSVKVQSEKLERTIKPGQQAVINEARINVVEDVDLEQVMAWKEGKFVFKNTNIQGIMRQMERWYDLEPTEFKRDEDRQWAFNGQISRYNNASKVLQLLEETAGSVKFKIEGKKIIVSQ